MIFDCFTYAGESDLLALRLETLSHVVDRFVIAEGTRTFSGMPRALSLDLGRFAPFRDRITHIVVDDLQARPASAWVNEFRQRNALARGLAGARDDDLLLLSDVDEIPRPESLAQYRPDRYASAVLHQRMYYYALNHEMVESDDVTELPCRRARLTTVGHLRRVYASLQDLRIWGSEGRFPRLSGRVDRLLRDRLFTQQLKDAGWHFSYLMGPEEIVRKLAAFSHQEFNRPQFADPAHLRRVIASGQDLFGRERRFRTLPIDGSFPEPVRLNPERFQRWIMATSANASANTA